MVTINTSPNFFYKRQEIWFAEENLPNLISGNNLFIQSTQLPRSGAEDITPFQTLIFDLTASEEELFSKVNSTFRRHIRKAGKIDIKINKIVRGKEQFFFDNWHKWNELKEMGEVPISRIDRLIDSGKLELFQAVKNDLPIIFHAYIQDGNRARLFSSHHNVSVSDKNLIGYANKFLHWKKVLHYKNLGFAIYDFGGYAPEEVPGIAYFKRCFGGEIENSYNFSIKKGIYKFYNLIKS